MNIQKNTKNKKEETKKRGFKKVYLVAVEKIEGKINYLFDKKGLKQKGLKKQDSRKVSMNVLKDLERSRKEVIENAKFLEKSNNVLKERMNALEELCFSAVEGLKREFDKYIELNNESKEKSDQETKVTVNIEGRAATIVFSSYDDFLANSYVTKRKIKQNKDFIYIIFTSEVGKDEVILLTEKERPKEFNYGHWKFDVCDFKNRKTMEKVFERLVFIKENKKEIEAAILNELKEK